MLDKAPKNALEKAKNLLLMVEELKPV